MDARELYVVFRDLQNRWFNHPELPPWELLSRNDQKFWFDFAEDIKETYARK